MEQLVTRTKPRKITYKRKRPHTYEIPKLSQAELRILFAEAAKKAKGMKKTGKLPPAAEMVKKMLSGYRSRYKTLKLREIDKEMIGRLRLMVYENLILQMLSYVRKKEAIKRLIM